MPAPEFNAAYVPSNVLLGTESLLLGDGACTSRLPCGGALAPGAGPPRPLNRHQPPAAVEHKHQLQTGMYRRPAITPQQRMKNVGQLVHETGGNRCVAVDPGRKGTTFSKLLPGGWRRHPYHNNQPVRAPRMDEHRQARVRRQGGHARPAEYSGEGEDEDDGALGRREEQEERDALAAELAIRGIMPGIEEVLPIRGQNPLRQGPSAALHGPSPPAPRALAQQVGPSQARPIA